MDISGETKPLRLEIPFKEAPHVGGLWMELGEIENEIAVKLIAYPLSTAVVLDGQAWMLKDEGEALVLIHGSWADGQLSCATSRFDLSHEWVDIEEEELNQAICTAQQALLEFDTLLAPARH